MKKTVKNTVICLIFATFLAFLICVLRGIFRFSDERFKILSDGCFVSGGLFVLLFCLIAVSEHGAFDGISFAFSTLFSRLFFFKKAKKQETYYEYKTRKKADRGEGRGRLGLLISGTFYLVLSVIFACLYG